MDEKVIITMPNVGLDLNSDPIAILDGDYTYALNATDCSYANEPLLNNLEGNLDIEKLPKGYMNIGSRKLDKNDTVITLVDVKGNSEIGLFSNDKYVKIVNDIALKFDIKNHNLIRFKTNHKGERIIYWTNGKTSPMWLNLENPKFLQRTLADGCTKENTDKLDIDFLKIFKDYDKPCLKLISVNEDGNLKSGGYFITAQYANVLGIGLTACFTPIGVIPIFDSSIASAPENILGSASNKPTNKSITISINNPDLSFSHINIIIVKITDGIKQAFKVATIPIDVKTYTYNGFGNTEIPMTLDEVILPEIKYETAKCIDTNNSELILGNLTSKKPFNFQKYFQNIEVQWQSFKANANDTKYSYKNPVFAAYMKTFRRDEVYALGAVIDFIDGTYSDVIHLPGRKKDLKSNGKPFTQSVDQYGVSIDSSKWDSNSGYTNDDIYELGTVERHQVYNTATIEGNSSTGNNTGLSYYGEMGFYESTDLYPCDKDIYGDDAGKPIRHHKTPDSSILHIHDGEDANRPYEKEVNVYYLGIKLNNIDEILNSLPADIKKTIKGWRLVIGDRTYNKSVLASGIVLNAFEQNWKYNEEDKDDFRIYPNYPLNDLRPDPYISNGFYKVSFPPDPKTKNTKYSKSQFFFHSPDTHFKRQYVTNTELKINVELTAKTKSYYDFCEPYAEFQEKPKDNDKAALQGYSIATFNNFSKLKIGNIRRKLNDAFYIPHNSKVAGGSTNKPIWNTLRESSVFLNVSKDISNPQLEDTSRFILNDTDNPPAGQEMGCSITPVERQASLYYTSIKNNINNQYGLLSDINYVDTYPCVVDYLNFGNNIIFGGDTFIGRFSLKLQHSFYQINKKYINVENGLEGANFRPTETIAHTNYFYKNTGTGGNARNQSHMMCEDNTGKGIFGGVFGDGDTTALGNIALTMTGVPTFWVESDLNIELRHPGERSDETFYPNLNSGLYKIEDWLSIGNSDKDNVFYCNEDYSVKNNIKLNSPISSLYDPKVEKDKEYQTRVIQSLSSQPEDIDDNWLKFKALNYYDLPKHRGPLIDIRYIGGYRTLFRMKESVFLDSLVTDLETSTGKVSLGTGKLFQRVPEEIVTSDNGYGGAVSQLAFNNTEFGPLFIDAEKGEAFRIGQRLEPISGKISNWLKDNLPFNLTKNISNLYSVDNACNPKGIGIITEYDTVNKIWFVTKIDYALIDPSQKLTYINNEFWINNRIVNLKDTKIFENKSWTLSYKPETNRWKSWHSFIPNFYINQNTALYSGINEENTSIWKHYTGKMHTYYGKYYPFIIEAVYKKDGVSSVVNPTTSFITRAIADSHLIKTFNKAIVYNFYHNSGLLNLVLQDENNLSTLFKQLANYNDSRDVSLRFREGNFNFSDFYNTYKNKEFPQFANSFKNEDYANNYPIDKVVNTQAYDYKRLENDYELLRDKWFKIRLILDNDDSFKLLISFIGNLTRYSNT